MYVLFPHGLAGSGDRPYILLVNSTTVIYDQVPAWIDAARDERWHLRDGKIFAWGTLLLALLLLIIEELFTFPATSPHRIAPMLSKRLLTPSPRGPDGVRGTGGDCFVVVVVAMNDGSKIDGTGIVFCVLRWYFVTASWRHSVEIFPSSCTG